MVMTLRKRVAPAYAVESEPESDSDSDSEAAIPIPAPKRKKKKRSKKEEEEEEISSESDESDSDDEGDKENEVGVGYENLREQRIRENRERMEKLGIFTLTSQLYNSKKPKSKPVKKPPPPKKKRYPPLYPRSRSDSSRRSSRGGQFLKSEGLLEDLGISIPDGWKAELYSEEDEKLLGQCQAPWTLKVDGFSEDGYRLYDPDGTPCHQCRQKVLGKLTYCGKCRSAHGILCGDCLYTRYGENVLEAVQNPSWLCPVCRGICNCSRCRRSKGWEPVNIQHSKLTEKGFKSVAHYLILTRRAGATPKDMNDGIVTVDLTTEDTTAPQQDEGSDYSAESSESGSDDSDSEDDSKGKNGSKEHSVEMQVGSADMFNEAAVTNDNDQVLQEPENLEASLAL